MHSCDGSNSVARVTRVTHSDASRSTKIYVQTILCASLMVFSSCVRYEPEPIDLNQVFDDWKSIDAQRANTAVEHALHGKKIAPIADFNLKDGISLAEAEITALFFNPSIRATRLRIGIPQAEAKYAKLWEDPELGINGEYILANVSDPLVFGAGLNITIPLSGRLGVAKKLAEDKITEAEASAMGAEWALINVLRQQWIDLAALHAKEILLIDAVSMLERLVQAGANFKAAQAISIVEERLLVIQYKQSQAALEDIQSKLSDQELMLITTMGLYPSAEWKLLADMPEKPVNDQVVDYVKTASTHPQLRIALAAYNVAERQLELEVRKQYPDLSIGFGGGVEDGEGRLLFGLGLLPIPMWNANKSGIAQATVSRQLAAAHIEQALKDLVYRLFLVHKRDVVLQKKYDFFNKEIIPLSDQQLKDVVRLASAGQLDLFLLVNALELSRESSLTLLDYKTAHMKNAFKLNALQSAPWNTDIVEVSEITETTETTETTEITESNAEESTIKLNKDKK